LVCEVEIALAVKDEIIRAFEVLQIAALQPWRDLSCGRI
jgi:hypothetical protein